jgi:REP element-mobilizing transposase RayT
MVRRITHISLSLLARRSIADLIGHVKRDSSVWIKKEFGIREFQWQEGYGAFSIGQSQVPAVMKYIANQKQHHARQVFEDEFRGLLKRYDVDHDERYVCD